MRVATFNVESLDGDNTKGVALSERIEILRPQFTRLNADILCLQEVNSQRMPGDTDRSLSALKQLLDGTPYASFDMAASRGGANSAFADVHNLVILSRYPIQSHIELKHTLVAPPQHQSVTALPCADNQQPVIFERPALIAEVSLPGALRLTVINVHLRAPLASPVAGQKLSAFAWKSTQGWAEGYFLSALKRTAQALEVRLALDSMFDNDPHHMTVVCGDFNCQDHDTPLRILQASEDDTGNPHLALRSLVIADRAIPEDLRFSVVHRGRPQMLDHILVTRALAAHLQSVHVHNEMLIDETTPMDPNAQPLGSYHAPLVAAFSLT